MSTEPYYCLLQTLTLPPSLNLVLSLFFPELLPKEPFKTSSPLILHAHEIFIPIDTRMFVYILYTYMYFM